MVCGQTQTLISYQAPAQAQAENGMRKILNWFESKRSSAQRALEQSIVPVPSHPSAANSDSWRKRGGAFLVQGQLEQAFDCFQKGVELNPQDALCFSNLGFIHAERGQVADAMACLQKAVALDPGNYDAYFMMGNLKAADGDPQAAMQAYENALRVKPDFSVCRDALCGLLTKTRALSQARHVLQAGFAHERDLGSYYAKSGNLAVAEGKISQAVVDFKKALTFKPTDTLVLNNLATAQLELRDLGAAIETCHALLAHEPENMQAVCNLGVAYLLTGKYEQAIQRSRRAMEIDPQYLTAHQNLLYMLSFGMSCGQQEYLDEAVRYGQKVSALAKPYTQWLGTASGDADRPLRVGLVSGDLHQHPVGYFLESIVQNMDAAQIELIAYSNDAVQDALTLRIMPHFKEWYTVDTLSDQELAGKIHTDAIDILIDLSGHTQLNRLATFAWRPAPVQVSWLGYWASTGVKEIDYILVDELSAPHGEQCFYTEKFCYLPTSRLCFTPPHVESVQDLEVPPVCANGFVTFASYQAVHKISDNTLNLWSRIMQAVPSSQLRLQNAQLDFVDVRQELRDRLTRTGVDVARVQLFGHSERQNYLRSYREVDLVLDTFPYPGGTTTAEALWMGVPTVTMTGATLLARQGHSILNAVGLQKYVASSEEEYLAIAIRQAQDVAGMVTLRGTLRATVLQSALFDAKRFSQHFTDSLKAMKLRGSSH